MSTRGTYGFRHEEKDKLVYAPTDANPDNLGRDILSYISRNSLDSLIGHAKTGGTAKRENENFTENFMNRFSNAELFDSRDFPLDSSLEWTYIMNLDIKSLEVHSSSLPQLNHAPKGRYIVSSNSPSYKGAALVHEIPFNIINSNSEDYHVNAIKTARDNLFHISQLIEQMKINEDLKKQSAPKLFSRILKRCLDRT